MRCLVVLLLVMLGLAGCAAPQPPPPPPVVFVPPPAPPPAPPVAEPEPRQDKLKHLANRKLKPLPTQPLNAKTSCGFRDPNGYRGRLRLDVKDATVKRLEASVEVPRKGQCTFKLRDFQQTESAPIVVLAARKGDCRISLWEQEHQLTVAFRSCQAECSGKSVDYLWPILVDNRKGRCS